MANSPSSLAGTSISDLMTFLTSTPLQRSNFYKIGFTGINFSNTLPSTTNGAFFASLVQVPSRTILFYPDTTHPFLPPYKVPLQHQYDDRFLVEFLVDQDGKLRRFIETWMDEVRISNINSGQGSPLFSTKNQACAVKMTVEMLDGTGKPTLIYTFYDVWPKLILPSEMSSDNIQFLKLQVDFNYRYYTTN